MNKFVEPSTHVSDKHHPTRTSNSRMAVFGAALRTRASRRIRWNRTLRGRELSRALVDLRLHFCSYGRDRLLNIRHRRINVGAEA